jgi:ABC-type transport system involved in multi-copper enzyme maturation permease subunit
MPFLAIYRHDLRVLWSSWLVRMWILATALLALIQVLSSWNEFPTAPLIAVLLFPYLVFPWSLVVMMLSVGPASGWQAEIVADSFLSRPVSRHAYLLATWTARVTLVLSVFLIVTVPAITVVSLAKRPTPPDPVTAYGIASSLAVVALVLAFLVSAGFLLATVLRNTWLALVLLVFLWFPVNLLLHTFSLEEFSPISLAQALPTVLRQPWREVEPVESGTDPEAALADTLRFLSSLGGGASVAPPREDNFFNREDFTDVSLRRILLGYGTPLLLSISIATFCFCLRDI